MRLAYADPPYPGCAALYKDHPDDDLVDLFPGTGAVTRAWQTWRGLFVLPAATPRVAPATNRVAPQGNHEVTNER